MIIPLLSHKNKLRANWPVALILLFMVSPVFAQVIPTGTISGVVKDSTGLSVPNASVTVVNVESNHQRTAMTSDDGAYRFSALAIGHYNVKVEVTGFKTETQKDLTLDVAQEAVVNFRMEVGAIQQQTAVNAEEFRVDTTTSSLGHIVDNNQLSELPLNGRNFVDLTLMQTGITQFQNNNFGTKAFSENSIAVTALRSDRICTRSTAQSWETFKPRAPHRSRVSRSGWMGLGSTKS
jgi:hypothetical protein